jgi:hypothetical protein
MHARPAIYASRLRPASLRLFQARPTPTCPSTSAARHRISVAKLSGMDTMPGFISGNGAASAGSPNRGYMVGDSRISTIADSDADHHGGADPLPRGLLPEDHTQDRRQVGRRRDGEGQTHEERDVHALNRMPRMMAIIPYDDRGNLASADLGLLRHAQPRETVHDVMRHGPRGRHDQSRHRAQYRGERDGRDRREQERAERTAPAAAPTCCP